MKTPLNLVISLILVKFEDVLAKKYVKGVMLEIAVNIMRKRAVFQNGLRKPLVSCQSLIRVKLYKPINAWFNRKAEGIKSQLVDGQFAFHYKTEHLGRISS